MNNRRQFLKSVFGVVAGLVAAPSVVKAKDKPTDRVKGFKLGEGGLKEAFVYGGKLFRVFPGYFDERYVMMSLREGRYENNRMITRLEFDDIQFRHFNCEVMLEGMEKKTKYHPIFSPLTKRTKELLRERGIEIPKTDRDKPTSELGNLAG